IEMCLCIAGEADVGQYGEGYLVAPLVDRADEQQRCRLGGKDGEVDGQVGPGARPVVQGHRQALLIAVTNLVRNAVEHTPAGQGPIAVHLRARDLLVTNRRNGDDAGRSTPDGAPASNRYGLGLGIVQRLCERNGWEFSLQVDEARVTARLSW